MNYSWKGLAWSLVLFVPVIVHVAALHRKFLPHPLLSPGSINAKVLMSLFLFSLAVVPMTHAFRLEPLNPVSDLCKLAILVVIGLGLLWLASRSPSKANAPHNSELDRN